MSCVLFISARPLDRAENIKAVWDAYDGEKEFMQTGTGREPDYRGEKYSLLVADELPNASPGKCIFIGHGMGAGKSYGLQQPGGYFRHPELITYAIASSEDMIPYVARFAGIPKEKVIPLGMPRTDAYFKAEKAETKQKHFLYAPTFRWWDWQPNWERLSRALPEGSVIDVKAHMVTGWIMPRQYSNIQEYSARKPSTPFLVQADAVITDYSSIMFDAMVLRKPVILFALDKDEYLEKRGMYCEYPERYSKYFCESEKALGKCMEQAEWDDYSEELRQFYAGACDGSSTARTIDLIKSVLEDEVKMMKVILPNGVIAESNNPVTVEQWKKAGYKEVVPAKPAEPPVEKAPETKRKGKKK